MPESRKRKKKKDLYTPPASATQKKPVRLDSPRWLPIAMVVTWIIGIAWMVAWYLLPIPFLESLGAWNVLIGFGFLSVGFILATRWR
jgi:Cell division protein CrgA